jgi:hypothetical protein
MVIDHNRRWRLKDALREWRTLAVHAEHLVLQAARRAASRVVRDGDAIAKQIIKLSFSG